MISGSPFSTTFYSGFTSSVSHYNTGNLVPGELRNFATAYDSFTIGNGALVTQMQWVGTYEIPANARTNTFRIGVYNDVANAPGSLVVPEFVVTAVEAATPVADFFHYTADLTPFGFTAASATKYWFAVAGQMPYEELLPRTRFGSSTFTAAGQMPSRTNGFKLAFSSLGDGRSVQDYQNSNLLPNTVMDRFIDATNYAMAITVGTVPEPSSWLIFAAAVGTIGARRERRCQASKKV